MPGDVAPGDPEVPVVDLEPHPVRVAPKRDATTKIATAPEGVGRQERRP